MAAALNTQGVSFYLRSDYANAIEHYTRSLKIREELGDQKGTAGSLNNIGVIYNILGDYVKAIDYYARSLKIDEELGNKKGIAMSLNNIGVIYEKQGDYAKALDYHTRSLKIREEIGDKNGIAQSFNYIGKVYYKQGDYPKALEKSTKALSIAQEIGVVEVTKNASENLWEINKELGNHKHALEMHELYIQMRDSILSIENKTATIHLGFKYEYEKEQALADAKHNELMHIKSEQIKTQNEKIEKERVIKYSLFIGMLIVIASLFVIFKNLRKTKLQKALIETQHKDLTSSITYAKRIQAALLPTNTAITESFKESFIFYLPKDIVAGDFY